MGGQGRQDQVKIWVEAGIDGPERARSCRGGWRIAVEAKEPIRFKY